MLCDSCDRVFHTYCVGLGVTVPDGDWFCPDCIVHGSEATRDHSALARATNNPPNTTGQQAQMHQRPAPQAPLHRASRGSAIPVAHRSARTGSTAPAPPGQVPLAAAQRSRVRSALPRRAGQSAVFAVSSDSESDDDTLASRRAQLEREAQRARAHAVAVPAHRALARNRHNWDNIRAGEADFSDPVGALPTRQLPSEAALRHAEVVGLWQSGHRVQSPRPVAGSPARRQRRPRERPGDLPGAREASGCAADDAWLPPSGHPRAHRLDTWYAGEGARDFDQLRSHRISPSTTTNHVGPYVQPSDRCNDVVRPVLFRFHQMRWCRQLTIHLTAHAAVPRSGQLEV
jgi:PHD-finger